MRRIRHRSSWENQPMRTRLWNFAWSLVIRWFLVPSLWMKFLSDRMMFSTCVQRVQNLQGHEINQGSLGGNHFPGSARLSAHDTLPADPFFREKRVLGYESDGSHHRPPGISEEGRRERPNRDPTRGLQRVPPEQCERQAMQGDKRCRTAWLQKPSCKPARPTRLANLGVN